MRMVPRSKRSRENEAKGKKKEDKKFVMKLYVCSYRTIKEGGN